MAVAAQRTMTPGDGATTTGRMDPVGQSMARTDSSSWSNGARHGALGRQFETWLFAASAAIVR